jgi:hypothetical protein
VGVVLIGFSLTMLAVGIIAQYIALIYEEVKGRPLYLIAERTDENLFKKGVLVEPTDE